MITCTLGEKKYSVNYISGRALREIDPASRMYARLVKMANDAVNGVEAPEDKLTITEALDVLVKWFCVLFGNQFSSDDMYDYYPVDRLVHDIALAIMAVQTQTTAILDSFPTTPAADLPSTAVRETTQTVS